MKTIQTRPVSRNTRTINPGPQPGQPGAKQAKGGLSLSKIMLYAPIVLEVVNLLRQNQKAKQGKFYKARKRDKAFDFVLGQANRHLGGKKQQKRGWF